jgi:hypothetical protein
MYWNTPCPSLGPDKIVAVISISLCLASRPFRHLLSRWHFWKFNIFINCDIFSVHVIFVSANLVDHHGELLVQNGAVVNFQWGLQLGSVSTNQSNQLWLRIFGIIQNPWRIGRSVNNKSCSKLEFLTPWIFPDFSSLPGYFSRASDQFWSLLKFWNRWRVGPCGQWHYRPAPRPGWLPQAALSEHAPMRVFRRRLLTGLPEATGTRQPRSESAATASGKSSPHRRAPSSAPPPPPHTPPSLPRRLPPLDESLVSRRLLPLSSASPSLLLPWAAGSRWSHRRPPRHNLHRKALPRHLSFCPSSMPKVWSEPPSLPTCPVGPSRHRGARNVRWMPSRCLPCRRWSHRAGVGCARKHTSRVMSPCSQWGRRSWRSSRPSRPLWLSAWQA